ncbi:VanZ family protein [Chryseobacterium sp. JUb7]|uniref:VanZ family protein n=1 Tax=Chryseobacterium sp. JUb7 TaxID=2940599 RepID=UPI0021681A23|nr:VanZ family protein [Chryseobacterium sp. JUb7]MCS3533107.1 glycopeptide antibiotics resistance protein [Chryseobacterium sp. JUb7]
MKRNFAVLITLYSIFLLYMMFFASGRQASDNTYFQLIPFNTIHIFFADTHIHKEDFLVNIIGNVFVFSPFGWLGLCVNRFNKIVPITQFFLFVIITIEITQSITGRGVADIDDVFLNTLGMLIGFYIFKFVTFKNIANIRFHFDLDRLYKLQTSI